MFRIRSKWRGIDPTVKAETNVLVLYLPLPKEYVFSEMLRGRRDMFLARVRGLIGPNNYNDIKAIYEITI